MTVLTFPSTIPILEMTWGQVRNDVAARSAFGSQTLQVLEPWWTVGITIDIRDEEASDELMGLVMGLEGQKNQLALWNHARPAPRGTMRGSPVLTSIATAPTRSIAISGGTPGGTLRVGDMLGIGTGLTQQLVMVQTPVTLNGSGAGTINFLPGLRNSFASGTAVVWDKPKCLFRKTENTTAWTYSTSIISSMSMDFVEDPRP